MTSLDPAERSWDLSLYELHRTPQEAITDQTEIAVSAQSLKSELTCPICLDMLTRTMTTKECLHRSEAIVTYVVTLDGVATHFVRRVILQTKSKGLNFHGFECFIDFID